MAVCSKCGAHGFFVRVNQAGICKKCAELMTPDEITDALISESMKKLKEDNVEIQNPHEREMCHEEMTSEEIADALVSGDIKKLEKLEKYSRETKEQQEREMRYFEYYFNKYNKARELERNGRLDKALSIYLSILPLQPGGTLYYERPCILLEKMHRYEDALYVCELAIERIQKKAFNADLEPFEKRKARLEKKIIKEKEKKPKPTEEEIIQFWIEKNEEFYNETEKDNKD